MPDDVPSSGVLSAVVARAAGIVFDLLPGRTIAPHCLLPVACCVGLVACCAASGDSRFPVSGFRLACQHRCYPRSPMRLARLAYALCAAAAAACSRSDPPRQAPATTNAPPRPSQAAPKQAPPHPADLIDITSIDPAVRIDIRYATANNFTGVAFYPVARCLLRREAAERLARVDKALAARGFGLEIWDCYRPFSVQRRLWQIVSDSRYVAEPVTGPDGTPLEGSKHNRGAAVDLTLVRADGRALEMPTEYDDFSSRARRGDDRASPAARRNAELLEQAMAAEGFEPLPTEWWHFDAPGWQRYPLSDQSLDQPSAAGAGP